VTNPSADEDLQALRTVLSSYFNVDMGDGVDALIEDAARRPQPPYIPMVRRGLEQALRRDLISRDELVTLTHQAFDSEEEARGFLQRIWDRVFAGRVGSP
jgi:hypothetical protein